MEGYIKLYKQLLDWEWYDDNNTFKLFIHCLLKANYTDKNWRGLEIKRGSFVTSLGKLADETSMSLQNLRTSIKRLKSTSELTIKTSNKNSIITVVRYDKYQSKKDKVTSKLTNKQQSNNIQLTTTKEYKNIKNINTMNSYSSKLNFERLVDYFNLCTGKKTRIVNDKAKRQLKARLKDGYKKEDIAKAILNASKSKHHKESNYKHLTLELISRPEKFDMFLHMEDVNVKKVVGLG